MGDNEKTDNTTNICSICGKAVKRPVEAFVEIDKDLWTHHRCFIDYMIRKLDRLNETIQDAELP
ncbi:TPA: hypothetical protein HA265_00275 [Candidatus Woesearchaeota archaeon]|nr:hypothetical protein [Candidatus Woesearchaeota archaeon]